MRRADETDCRENGHNGAWLLATSEGERYVEFPRSRAGAIANSLLGDGFGGVLVADFYGGYNDTPGHTGRQHQRCWGHLRPDVHALTETHANGTARADLEVRAWTDAVRALWHRIHATVSRTRTRPPSHPEQRHALMQDVAADGRGGAGGPGRAGTGHIPAAP